MDEARKVIFSLNFVSGDVKKVRDTLPASENVENLKEELLASLNVEEDFKKDSGLATVYVDGEDEL